MAKAVKSASKRIASAVQANEAITTSKKRARKEAELAEDRPTKRTKSDASPEKKVRVSIKRATQSKVKGKSSGSKATDVLEPKWKVLPPAKSSRLEADRKSDIKTTSTELRPRIWTSNREELLSTLPELAGTKCINGISWLLYETPVLLLDETTAFLEVCRQNMDAFALDLVTTQTFTCPLPPGSLLEDPSLLPIAPELLADVKPDPENLTLSAPIDNPLPDTKPRNLRQIRTYPPVKSTPYSDATNPVPASHLGLNFAASLPAYSLEAPGWEDSLPSALPSNGCVRKRERLEVQTVCDPLGQLALPEALVPDSLRKNKHVEKKRKQEVQAIFDPVGQFVGPDVADMKPSLSIHPATTFSPLSGAPALPKSISERAAVFNGSCANSLAAADYQIVKNINFNDPASIANFQSIAAANFGVPLRNEKCDFAASLHPKAQRKWLFRNQQQAVSNTTREFQPVLTSAAAMDATSNLELQSQPKGSLSQAALSKPTTLMAKTEKALSPSRALDAPTSSTSIHDPVPVLVQEPDLITTPEDPMASHIPSPIPQELQAMIDAYIFGRPVTLIISNQRLHEDWSLLLAKEYGYAMMGFFRILGVEESRIQILDSKKASKTSTKGMSGQVKWRFRLKWSPGGEECIFPLHDPDDFEHPWWKPAPPLPLTEEQALSSQQESAVVTPAEPEDDFPTTPHYREARLRHPEHQYRHDALKDLYHCIVPPHLLIPFSNRLFDGCFPRGWVCTGCGRMNFQAAIRHRKCPSPSCKGDELLKYAHELLLLRDPQDRISLSLPYNTFPDSVEATLGKFDGGMQTLSYYCQRKGQSPFIKHIFTGNLPRLQFEANEVLKSVQLELQITRKCGDNGPYFTYSATPKENLDRSNPDWTGESGCVNRIKHMLVNRAEWFGEVAKSLVSVNHIDIFAWVTSGRKKSTQPIRAKKKSVIFICLGANTVLTVIPCSMKGTAAELPPDEVDQPVQPVDTIADGPEGNAGWIGDDPEDDATAGQGPSEVLKEKKAAPKKDAKPTFVISLVHGDAVVFHGDDFEYSVKREGTSFLLMGSHKNVK